MVLLLDNYDSFTYNLVDYFQQLGIDCAVFRNDHNFRELTALDCQALVISPGPEVPKRSGNLMRVLNHFQDKIPILGICLGHQAIGEYFGAELVRAKKPMHGKICKAHNYGGTLFRHLPPKFNVVQYNSLIIQNIPDSLEITAMSENDEIMGIQHKTLPIYGVQFHPEAALTEYGLEILKNWLVYNNITL